MLKTFELNQLISDKFSFASDPLYYNLKKSRFCTCSVWCREIISFHFCWIFLMFCLWPVYTIYVIVYKGIFHPETISAAQIFYTVLLTGALMLSTGATYILLREREYFVDYINLLMNLGEYYLRPLNNLNRQRSHRITTFKVASMKILRNIKAGNLDTLDWASILNVFILSLFTLVYLFVSFTIRVDPFQYPLLVFFEYDHYSIWFRIPFRLVPAICAIVCTSETMKTFRTLFLYALFIVGLTNKLLQRIHLVSFRDLSVALMQYRNLFAVHAKYMKCAGLQGS